MKINMKTNIKTRQKTDIKGMQKYANTYIFSFVSGFNFEKNKNFWKNYIIPLKRKKENISKNIDKILY